ncbi:hypothetical protein F5Y10DRAFT_256692 [Nemania abortiva]|nr:hypothetical protein F5Y10DRAFT_256692 [Nemania abortiva]
MDPLSVAGSIAGLVALADAVFRGVYKYYKSVSDAPREIEELADRLKSLAGVLHSLKILADVLEQNGTPSTVQMTHISNTTKLLGDIKERLDQYQSKKSNPKLDTIRQSFKWSFTKTKTKDLTERLSQQQEIIGLALHSDSLSNLLELLGNSKDIKKQISSVKQGVENLQMLTRVEVDAERQRILDFFLKVNPQPNLDTSIKLRHPGTGNWLIESAQFQQWIESTGSIWLSGIPGSGKTVLAGAVIQKALEKGKSSPKIGVAFFFCDYKDPKAIVLSNILAAIASQLARQNEQAFGELKERFESLHPKDGLAKDPSSDVLQDCLEEMFQYFDQIILVVDGLDECGDNTDEVTRALANIADYSTNVTMALASRDEYNIELKLQENFTRITIGAHKEDILLYVGSEIDKRMEDGRLRITNVTLKDEILTTLSNEADGMFRWVTCQLDYLRDCPTDADRRAALKELPPTLDETYERILRRINRGRPRARRIVQKCLQLISVKLINLQIDQLCHAISVPDTLNAMLEKDSIISEEEISRLCSSFIRKSENGLYFEFPHFTVREFLERETLLNDRELADYHLSEPVCNAALAQQCLRYLHLRNFYGNSDMDKFEQAQNIQEIIRDSPFYIPATFEWLPALRHAPQDPDCLELVESLFHPRKPPAFVSWATRFIADRVSLATRISRDNLRRATSLVTDPTFRTIHLAAALDLPETCEYLLRADAKWNTVSVIGTPLECSIGRMSSLLNEPFQASRNIDLAETRRGLGIMLYATHRPGQTTELLGTAGSTMQYPLRKFGIWSLMMCAIFSSTSLLDFSPVSNLICMGWVVSEEEATRFEEDMAYMAQSYPDGYSNGPHSNRTQLTASLLGLINSLNGFRIVNTGPGCRMCVAAWNTAVKLECSFAENTTLMDTRVTLSLEALAGKCKVAVSNDDVESMKRYLEDGRIADPKTDDDDAETSGYSLLNQAIEASSVKILKLLIDRGYSLNKPLSGGSLPIHSAVYSDENTIRLLLESGASHLAPNTDGRSIWHLAVDDYECGTVSALLKLTGEDKIRALQMQDNDGFTPLALAIGALPKAADDYEEDATATVNLLLDACGADPLCWRCTGSPWHLVALSGSAAAVSCLAKSGVDLDPIQSGQCTPLHVLNENASKECVELLIGLFPAAKDLQYEGQIPIERLIYQCLQRGTVPQEGVIESLAHDDMPSKMTERNSSLWKFCTDILASESFAVIDEEKGIDSFDNMLPILFDMNVIEAYEESGRSASIPLFSSLSNGDFINFLNRDHLNEVISRTKFWASARLAKETIKYVKSTIERAAKSGDLDSVEDVYILLRNEVDVHVRSGSSSILETACEILECGPRDHANTESVKLDFSVQRRIFEEIVDRASPERLNATQSSANRCLQSLLYKGNHSGLSWMLEKLVMRGLDPDKPRLEPHKDPPLVYSLEHSATSAALILLKLGADPTMTGIGGFNTLHAAAVGGCLEFLKFLLSQVGRNLISSLFEATTARWVQLEGSRSIIRLMNTLHFASIRGHTLCLQFLVDNVLVLNAESTAKGGYNCLHFAAIGGHCQTIEYLFSLGLDINQPADDGSLPIHLAVRNGHHSVVETLLRLGSVAYSDGFGMTPQSYAEKLGYDRIRELLEEKKASSQSHVMVSKKRSHGGSSGLLLRTLESAIEQGELNTCERLYAQGCPLDLPMPSCGGCSPIIVAIRSGWTAVIQWLLTKYSSVLRVACKRHGEESTLRIAIENRGSSSYLEQFLDTWVKTACNTGLDGNPILDSVAARNHVSLRLVVEHIKRNLGKYSILTGDSQQTVLAKMVNETYPQGYSALHLAAYNGGLDIIETLLDAGADVDMLDFNNLTPLQATTNLRIIARLVSAGSNKGWLDSTSWANMTLRHVHSLGNPDFPHKWRVGSRNLPGPIVNIYGDLQRYFVSPELLYSAVQQGVDLNLTDHSQKTLIHSALCNEKATSYLLNLPQVLDCDPFPWHAIGCQIHRIPWIDKHWRLFKRRIPATNLRRMMNLHPEQGISPLCQAAAIDALDIIDHCLEMGASIDFDGSSYGSALMAACANCRLKAVKHLVRRGASIVYHGEFGVTSALEMADGHKKIIAWLLVGQFTEQPKLEYPVLQDPNDALLFRPWSGCSQKPMRLVGYNERQPNESLKDYIFRLAALRNWMRGKALPLHRDPLAGLFNIVCYQI